MRKSILLFLMLACLPSVWAGDIYVATTGNDAADGSMEHPYQTIYKAVEEVLPGETIYVRGGTYHLTKRIKIPARNTTADARICLFGYPGERVVVDGSNIAVSSVNEFKMARCFYLNHEVNYWHFRNLEICNAKDNGMKIEGSYNIVENCVFHDNNDTGLQIGMYKDFSIEETKQLPAGTPQFNPDYQFCRYNVVINCDSYYNYDALSFNGTDDGGDADGFACKLFPGPGTEFIGCRAWNNSDDNWDLYMVYHPVRIEACWAWNAGYDKNGVERKNGNGFKLGGGGSSGGAAFDQSVGAHVVTNSVAFGNLHKGFDQNNAYEAMYLCNNVAWGNEYNYRFPTELAYGTMYLRNNIGFNPTKLNHEFLSENKEGSKLPDTEYNSWTTLDGCDPYKEGNKVNGEKVYTKDYTNQFKSLSVELAMAPREADGSLPENDFCQLVDGSVFVDKGMNVVDFVPARFMTEAEANGLQLVVAPTLTIPYNGSAADMGAKESGVPTMATLRLVSGNVEQKVYRGSEMSPVIYKWGQAATGVKVDGLQDGLQSLVNEEAKTVTISGIVNADASVVITTQGGENQVEAIVTLVASDIKPAILTCITGNGDQTIDIGSAIDPIVFEWGGGATSIVVENLPAGLSLQKEGNKLTIQGVPESDGVYIVKAMGGMEELRFTGVITRVVPTRVLTGDWYPIQDAYDALPEELEGVVSLLPGSEDTSYPTVWNPAYTENGGAVPGGCTIGAINMERGDGGVMWTLPSLAELKLNLHFTGKRVLKVVWQVEGEEEKSWVSSTLKKQTMVGWDLMANAGVPTTERPITVKLMNHEGSGGIRLYDFFVRVYKEGSSQIDEVALPSEGLCLYQTLTSCIVQGTEVTSIRVYDLAGRPVASSFRSQVVEIGKLPVGIYLLEVMTADGKRMTEKIKK